MWSTLAWFQYQEDPHRGDALEGTRRYLPAPGLPVTRIESGGRPDHAEISLPNQGLQFRARRHRHIYIYSPTTDPSLAVGDADTRARVKIFNLTSTHCVNFLVLANADISGKGEAASVPIASQTEVA